MPSYPIRPTFPIDVRSTPGITVTREGLAVRLDTNPAGIVSSLGPSRSQFFAALDVFAPGAAATLMAAAPSDPNSPTNRAFNGTAFVTAGSALAAFAKATLGLTDTQLATIIAQAAATAN